MDLLVLLLKEIDSDISIDTYHSEYIIGHPLVNAAKYMAHIYLKNGDSNNINAIHNAGFHIIHNMLDIGGWKKGYILLRRGIITYNITFPSYV